MPDKAHLDAIAQTDALLMADALGEEPAELNGRDEIAATNIMGHDQPGFDRPLQYERDVEHDEAIGTRDQEIMQLRQQLATERALGDPDYVVRQMRAEDDAISNMLADPRRELQEKDALRQQVQEARKQAVGENFRATHQAHGRAFEAAFGAFNNLDPRNPAHLAVGTQIVAHPDPGAALLQWHRSTSRGSGGPPFARGIGRRAPAAEPVEYDPMDMEDIPNAGGAGLDKDIMDSVWRD
jgi:hypothetical protein